jgi:hypothetical protein
MGRRALALVTIAVASVAALPGVAAARWSGPVQVTPTGGRVTYLRVAIDDLGDVVALGIADRPAPGLVSYSSHDRGPFGPPHQVLEDPSALPALTFDRHRTALALVSDDGGIEIVSKPREQDFGQATPIDPRAGLPVALARSPAGDLFAVWTGKSDVVSRTSVRVAVRPRGATQFGPVQQLSATDARGFQPKIAFDRAGNALILWRALRGRANARQARLEYAIRHPGAAFGTTQALSPPGVDTFVLGSNVTGGAVAAWHVRDGRRGEVRAALGTASAGFGEPELLGSPHADYPQVAVDARGEATVAWRSAHGFGRGPDRIRVATAPPGAKLGSPQTLFPGRANLLRLAADRGTTTAAWLTHPDGGLVAVRRRSGDAGFHAQTIDARNARSFTLKVAGQGRTVLAWSAAETNGFKRVKAAVATSGGPFGAGKTLATPGTAGSFYQYPTLALDGAGGAFAFWSIVFPDGSVAADGSYLLP